MKVNWSDLVTIRLSPAGVEIWNAAHSGYPVLQYNPATGLTEPLWKVANVFGHVCGYDRSRWPFEGVIFLLEDVCPPWEAP